MSYLIELNNITKIYRMGINHITALHGINLTIERSEMTAIVGVSGSGKSTLMNIMGLLDRVTAGKYYFVGQDVSHFSTNELAGIRNRHIGFIFQSFYLLPRVDALQNVMLPLYYRGIPREEAKEIAMAMLEKVGIAHLSQHRPNQLSSGQQQRVAIARALSNNPDVIFADEPTGALDSQTGSDVLDLFTELNRKEGRTIVIITHDKEVSRRCQRMITIKDGRMKE